MITVKTFTFNAYSENTYLLFDETKSCIIVDPGMYDAAEQNELTLFIKSNDLKPVLLLNTHCHLDHVFGNKFIFDTYGLKAQFHEGELPILTAVPGYAPSMGFTRYEVSPLPEVFLPESGTVRFGNSSLELIFSPGHSPAHLCFYSKADGFLIGGDVLFYGSIGRTDLPGGNHQQLIQNISTKLFVLPDETKVYPGHGPATTIGFEKQHNPFF
ncbi:MBL fold metallo-hydrolase [Pedobacter endophyticus]|uniref:MBL fold metallo-hydrolase n=1 Tax=Pedobacter endophyticus TaxID=2789740 RepID=A0A7U3Q4A4_9SPHI|nr:MBL fold metallo-hydrolase [Pedobacter endophyticus]QPH38334.1 MBL fold metallo-hydrolase [Pedobacter endophyticus]